MRCQPRSRRRAESPKQDNMPEKERNSLSPFHKFTLSNNEKVKEIVRSTKSKDLLLFAVAFLIASFFWLLQALNEIYETDLQVPVEISNLPEEVLITDPPVSHLTLTVREKGSTLLLHYFGNKNRPVRIDFNKWRNNESHTRIPVGSIEKEIKAALPGSTVLLGTKPSVIEYYYSLGEKKKVPVRLNIQSSTAIEYVVTDTLVRPDSVWAFAPTGILASLQEVSTQKDTFLQINDTVNAEIPLQKMRGVKFVPEKVKVTIPTDLLVEKTVEIPIVGTDFPPNKRLRTFPSKVNITFQVGTSKYNSITADNFVLVASYDELVNNTTGKYVPHLKTVPPGASHIRISPQEVEFLIEDVPAEN